jgi:DNA topoisomerase-1
VTRLRRSDSSSAGLRRLRAGKGFTYRDAEGKPVTPELRERIEALAIPPAWTDVWICPYPNGHIQATGVDAAGRTQYIYHPSWREKKDRVKFDRVMRLAESLPAARRRVTRDLRTEGMSKPRVLAAAFRMLDTGSLRVGSERYAEVNGSHGLSTLLCSHATVSGDTVLLRFPAKSGQEWDSALRDPELAEIVRVLKRRGPNARLLAWKDEGGWHPLAAEEINAYVRERTGGEFTAKDFRTLHGTVAAAVSLAKAGPQHTPTGRKRVVAQAMRDVADLLGNTPAVARSSYVDPRVVDHYDRGRTIDPARASSAEAELRLLLFD